VTDPARETELTDLARRNAVVVRIGDEFAGSGFLITPHLAVSCAHVVAGGAAPVVVEVGGRRYEAASVECTPAEPGDGDYYAFPDIALIQLTDPVPGRSGVLLAERAPDEGAVVLALGYSTYTTEDGPAVDSLHMRVVGRSGPLLRVMDDRVVPGMSGALVLDPVSGRVCGMVKATRDGDDVQGGWIVPCEALAEHTAAWSADAARHRPGTRWFDLAAGRAALTRALFGAQDLIAAPLSPPRDPRPSWWLDTRNQVVPFAPRPELDDLLAWCDDRPGPVVRLVTGGGGAGKTRLAMRLSRMLRRRGWIAGFLPHGRATALETVTTAVDAGYRVLLVLDYAETRSRELAALLRELSPIPEAVRVLLLARTDGPWWTTASTEFEQFVDPEPVALSPLAEHLGTHHVVTEAWRAFHSVVLKRPAPELPPRLADLDGPEHRQPVPGAMSGSFGDVLILHALVLDEVLAQREETRSAAPDPLRAVLGHEQRYWRRISREHGLALGLDDVRLRQTLLVPTLFAAADGEQAVNALQALGELSSAPDSEARPAARLLRQLYPHPEAYWAPMQPDRLGEALVLDVVTEAGTPDAAARLLVAVLSQCDAEQAEHAMTVLNRAVNPTPLLWRPMTEPTLLLAAALPALVRQLPRWFATAAAVDVAWQPDEVRAALVSVVRQADSDLLDAMHVRLSTAGGADREFKLLVTQELVSRLEAALPRRGWARSHPGEAIRLARALSDLAIHLDDVGEPGQAAEAAEWRADLARKMAGTDPARYGAGYAGCLDDLAARLYGLGRLEQALDVARSAAREWEAVVRREAQCAPRLVDAWLGVGKLYVETDRGRRGLPVLRQAAGLAIELAKLDRVTHGRQVARCLHLFSVALSREHMHSAAVEQAELCVAAAGWYELESPEELSTAADYAENYSRTLAAVGRKDEAIEWKRKCAQMRRQVVHEIVKPFSAFLFAVPGELPPALESLAVTLYGLAHLLRLAQRGEEADEIETEASRVHVRLADTPGPEGGNRGFLELTDSWMHRIVASDGFFRD
jgi:tetratricopeptide (TPR) repeat protein